MTVTATFHAVDYVLFSLTLVISAGIGIFFAWRDKKLQTTTEFLLGGRNMSLFPVSLSVMASFLSSVSVLGIPAEVFYNGAIYWVGIFSGLLGFPFIIYFILPVFHNLGFASSFEVSSKFFNNIHHIPNVCHFYLYLVQSA